MGHLISWDGWTHTRTHTRSYKARPLNIRDGVKYQQMLEAQRTRSLGFSGGGRGRQALGAGAWAEVQSFQVHGMTESPERELPVAQCGRSVSDAKDGICRGNSDTLEVCAKIFALNGVGNRE